MIGVKRIDSLGASILAAFVFSLLGAAIADSEGYIGCYKDSRARLLEHMAKASRNAMTPALCRQQCDGYAYFGMENHKECFCGNSLNHPEKNVQVPDSDCNRPCTGDKQMMCGGGWRLSVYGMPVDGGFGAWSAWGACSATCGGGQRSRARTCDNPAPSNGGSDCAGDATQQEGCGSELCPDPKTDCESVSGFRFYESRDHPAMCLRAILARMTYDQARVKCSEEGARLVTPKTRATLDFLFNVLPNDVTKNSGHWVGLDDQEEEGRFVWGDDGSVLPLDSDLWRADRGAGHLAEHGARDCAHTWTSQGVHSLSDTNCVKGARPAVCHLTDF